MQRSRPTQGAARAHPLRAALGVATLFAFGLACGALAGLATVERAQAPYQDLDRLHRVLTTIQQDHVQEYPPDQLLDAAIRGMVSGLDRQSQWLDGAAYRAWIEDAEGAVTGIGIEVRPAQEGLEVTRVLPDSPALRDGLAPGDRILAVDGHPLTGLAPEELRARFSGDLGASATLTILRPGAHQPEHVQTILDRLPQTQVEAELLAPQIAYVRLSAFSHGAAEAVEQQIQRLSDRGAQPLTGLILDLRDNPGGLLHEAVALADLFVDEGLIVTTRRRNASRVPDNTYQATPGGLPPSLSVVLLINGQSASASEIVAAALQEAGRAALVGEPTFGKGTVQQLYKSADPEPNALKLTVGWYYTRSGEPVAPGHGRQPDHPVPLASPPSAQQRLQARLQSASLDPTERESLLQLLAEIPHSPPEPTSIPWHLPIDQRPAADPQLAKALSLLLP